MKYNFSIAHHFPKKPVPELYQIYYIFAFSALGRQLVPFLRTLGLNCTEPQNNPAQGTVSTLIFFENIYLEMFWVEETSHLDKSDINTEFNFRARVNWLETGASPFGLGISYSTANYEHSVPATIKAIAIDKALISEPLLRFCPINLANPEEPICYFLSDYEAQRNRLNRTLAIAEQIKHPSLGMRKLTHIKLKVISDHILTVPLVGLGAQNLLDIEYGKHSLLELTFDYGNQKRFLDLKPLMPMVLKF